MLFRIRLHLGATMQLIKCNHDFSFLMFNFQACGELTIYFSSCRLCTHLSVWLMFQASRQIFFLYLSIIKSVSQQQVGLGMSCTFFFSSASNYFKGN
jgi:hypothetical protein